MLASPENMSTRRDSIKVFLRVRPDRNRKAFDQRYSVEHTFESSKIQFHVDRRSESDVVNHSVEDYQFRFDRVFEPKATQEDIFNMVAKDCALSALDGFNSTIFAYGQTGSGKTYSITGGVESYNDRGIIPRTLSLIFEEVAKRTDYEWSVRISYLQIYNDKGQDLLNRGKDARTLDDLPTVTVHESDDEIVLKGLEAHPTSTVNEALNLLFLGDTNRLYCETPMNKTSSRSHCIFTISLEARGHGSAVVRRSKLNLVDLAGSERVGKTGVSGNLLTEAKYINLSLHFLEHVIVSLSEHRDHIPFRNSTMTMVLRDSLGGNCRTAMLATAYPTDDMFMESISTCKFAQRVAMIKQNAHVNEETDPAILVRKLKAEIAQLKEQIAFYTKGGESDADRALSSDELQRCQELVSRYLEDNDPKSQITGLGGDLARVLACFAIMKTMIRGGGKVGSVKDAVAAMNGRLGVSSSNGAPSTGGGLTTEQERQLQQQVEALSISLQQKENELSLLFNIVEKHNAPKFNAQTQTAVGDSQLSSSMVRSSFNASSSNGTATALTPAAPSEGVLGMLSRSTAAGAARQVSQQSNLSAAQAQAANELFQRQEELRENYDLNALSDTEMIKDRATAFEAFRRSYRKFEQVDKNKEDLKGRYDKCKSLAERVNTCVDTIKQLKTRIQQLRAERALQGSSDPDPDEVHMMDRLASTKAEYTALAKDLGKEKEQVEHIHLIMLRAQEQLAKDFEEWFSLRQRQVLLAQSGGPTTSTTTGGGPTTAPQRPSPVIPLQPMFPPIAGARPVDSTSRPVGSSSGTSSISSSIMSQIQATQSQRAQVSSAPIPSSDAPSAHARVRSPPPPPTQHGNFVVETHNRNLAEHAQHNRLMTGLEAQNPYAPNYPSTGNAQADASLAEMYKAREEMRQRLLGR